MPDSQSEQQWAKFAAPGRNFVMRADLMNQSRLLSLFNSARVKIANDVNQLRSDLNANAESSPTLPADYWLTYPFMGPANEELKDAFATAEALLLATRDEAQSHHAEYWLFLLDMPPQVDPDPQERDQFKKRIGVDTLFKTDQLISDFSAKNAIRHMALAPEMARFAAEKSIVLHGFKGTPRNTGHLNEIGHKLAGRIIAHQLNDNSTVLSQRPVEESLITKGASR